MYLGNEGPSGANIFRPRDWGNTSDKVTNDITLEVTRIVLALGVFAIGVGKSFSKGLTSFCDLMETGVILVNVELPKSYMLRHWKSLALTGRSFHLAVFLNTQSLSWGFLSRTRNVIRLRLIGR